CVTTTPEVKAVQPLCAKDDLPSSVGPPKPASAWTKLDQVVEIVSAHVPGEIFDCVSVESSIGAELKKAEAFMRLAVPDPARVTMVIGEIDARLGKPVA